MDYYFRLYFNRRKQFAEVFLWEVHPNTFANWGGGRWGYWQPVQDRTKYGKFGELHFVKSRIRIDVIVHELDHLRTDYMWSIGETITRRNEEKYAKFLDELVRRFVRELRKAEPKVRL